ncbi:unnamed protein product [Pocillopora meandrina]|uniref:Uncharacterized protein n=1 Tax=Pocillopora meandrina TaxID=46732 RepID=A0AAU9VQ89_9CNID|nr:unnamed protein product [Pocillopora meandrina]
MGNFVDTPPVEAEEPSVGTSSDSDTELRADDYVIDLDAPEYHEYLMERKKSLSEGALLDDVTYLDWKRNNNFLTCFIVNFFRNTDSKQRNNREMLGKRLSVPTTGNEIRAVRKNTKEYEKRAIESKQRIDDVKKKYNLKNRDYTARTYVWNEHDKKQAKLEKQQRKLLRQQIRLKYNLPTPKTSRNTVIASG